MQGMMAIQLLNFQKEGKQAGEMAIQQVIRSRAYLFTQTSPKSQGKFFT